jgi:hypothetical protein
VTRRRAGDVYLANMKRALAVLVSIVCGVVLSGCGTSTKIRSVGGVIEIGRHVPPSSLVRSVLGIERGTKASAVRSRLGEPFVRARAGRVTCWGYHARQPGTAIDGLSFCMSSGQRVARIEIAYHL